MPGNTGNTEAHGAVEQAEPNRDAHLESAGGTQGVALAGGVDPSGETIDDTIDTGNVLGFFSTRLLGWILTIGSVAGLWASFTLTNDTIKILEDPAFSPSCNFSILMSCKSVILSEQGHVFGFKNPIAGLMGFGMVFAVGVALAMGHRLSKWFMLAVLAGMTFAVGWVQYFVFQTLFRIQVLCPWCMVVWTVTVPMFWYTFLHVVGRFTQARWLQVLRSWHLIPVVLWYLTVITLIFVLFWDYYWAGFFGLK